MTLTVGHGSGQMMSPRPCARARFSQPAKAAGALDGQSPGAPADSLEQAASEERTRGSVWEERFHALGRHPRIGEHGSEGEQGSHGAVADRELAEAPPEHLRPATGVPSGVEDAI